ncbi:hypothetical protein QQF64_007573, partial [Cirrhinus molitorella]
LVRFCWFKQSDPCYAALGNKLNLLMVQDDRNYDMKIQQRDSTDNNPVCRIKNGRMRKNECDLYNNRPEVTVINGILVINHVTREDSGNYRLTLTQSSDGTETSTDLHVNVEAPIGSVEVSIICSSSGVMRASCSSEGDQILYSWTLNGDPLMDGDSSINLGEGTDGDISCSVKNHVSYTQKTIRVKPCPEPTTPAVTSSLTSTVTISTQTSEYVLYYLIAGCTALILILLFITVCYVYKKKRLKSTPAAAGDTELTYTEKNETESLPAADVEYAAVSRQTKRKEKKKKEEDEVQYGEVTFTPNRPNAPQQLQEECIYSQVVRS